MAIGNHRLCCLLIHYSHTIAELNGFNQALLYDHFFIKHNFYRFFSVTENKITFLLFWSKTCSYDSTDFLFWFTYSHFMWYTDYLSILNFVSLFKHLIQYQFCFLPMHTTIYPVVSDNGISSFVLFVVSLQSYKYGVK